MRSQHKTGNKPGRPAYRTPATFRVRKSFENVLMKHRPTIDPNNKPPFSK